MENKTIFPIDEYVVSYKDNNFIILTTTAEGYTYCYNTKDMPLSAKVGDIITRYSNQATKSPLYQVTAKSNQHPKRLEQVSVNNDNIGYQIGDNFYKDEYLTYISNKFANAYGIKKIQNIQVSKYVIAEIFNHTVCLFNINNFNEQKYVADVELEPNATFGDIYYYLTINSSCGFIYDELAHFQLTANYSTLFSQLNSQSIKNNDNTYFPVDREKMQKLDKVNEKLFKKTFKFKFISSWQIDSSIKQDNCTKYILLNDDDKQLIVNEKDLPQFAREGDFIGITKDGKYEFNRPAYLTFLKKINNIIYGDRL